MRIEIYKTSSVFTDEAIIEDMKRNDELRNQLSLTSKFEIVRNGAWASVYGVFENE